MANQKDVHVGKRLRRRRRLLGLTQDQLAQMVGVKFQQIQKYECAGNRITAGKLFELACALNVPTDYFFVGLERTLPSTGPLSESSVAALQLVQGHDSLGEAQKEELMAFLKVLQDKQQAG